MRIIKKLEKDFSFWFLLASSLLFFFLRLPSLFEPYWYGDEGIYQAVGMLINSGEQLYSGAWDNKPPLLYVLYAILNSDQFIIRTFSLIFGIISIWFLYLTSRKLFPKNIYASIISTIIYVVAFGTRLIEGNIANAENFMILPILITAYLVVSGDKVKKSLHFRTYFIGGLLLSLAFMTKIVAIFDFLAFSAFILFNPEKDYKDKLVNKIFPFFLGFIIPVVVISAYFFVTNNFKDYMDAFIWSNIGYVDVRNNFIIPQGLLYIKSLILLGAIIIIYKQRLELHKSLIFVLLWLCFSLFNTFFSQRDYTHYVIMSLPAFCLLIGAVIESRTYRNYLLTVLVLSFILIAYFFDFKGSFYKYYSNFIEYAVGKKDTISYQAFFDGNTPRDYELANFIKNNTNENDGVFIWGNNAQVYKLAERNPIVRYTVAYHMTGFPLGISDMTDAINTKKPKYIIIMPQPAGFPLPLNNYSERIDIQGAKIYEKAL
jgi:hypothetical protein